MDFMDLLPNYPCHLLSLSDELLLLIVQQLDRHDDVPSFWMTCKKFKAMTEVRQPLGIIGSDLTASSHTCTATR